MARDMLPIYQTYSQDTERNEYRFAFNSKETFQNAPGRYRRILASIRRQVPDEIVGCLLINSLIIISPNIYVNKYK